MPRTNLVTNPSVEVDTTSYSDTQANSLVAGGVIARVTSEQQNRTASLQVTAAGASNGSALTIPGTFTVGVAYTCSVYLKGQVGGETIRTFFGYWITGDWVQTDFAITSAWARYSFTWTPIGTQSADIGLTVRNNAGPAMVWFQDAHMAEVGATATTYGDGATAGWAWTGTADASTSVELGGLRVPKHPRIPSIPSVGF